MFQFTDTKAICEKGAWVHIKDAGKPAYLTDDKGKPDKTKPVRIHILGPDSPTLQERARARVAKRLKENGGNIDLSKMSQVEIEAFLEKSADADAENWADATIGWENMPAPDGGNLQFSLDVAEMTYAQYPGIPRQLKDEGNDINDFLALAAEN